MSVLYRFDADGRYQGTLVVDRPLSQYADRADLTDVAPPDAVAGCWRRWNNGAWTQEPDATPALATVKDQKWREMKEQRRNAIEAPLATAYGTFDADRDARDNIIQTAHLMQTEAQTLAPDAVPTIDFTLADNSVATLTAGQMVEVALALADQIQRAYTRGRQVRAAIDAATTIEEVAAITWSTTP